MLFLKEIKYFYSAKMLGEDIHNLTKYFLCQIKAVLLTRFYILKYIKIET